VTAGFSVTCSAPGKLVLAGEYAVLAPGGAALVAADDRRLAVSVSPAEKWSVGDGRAEWTPGQPVPAALSFVAAVVDEARLRGLAPLRVLTHGDMTVHGRKLGLGSSAAVTVAAVGAVLGPEASLEQRWLIADRLHRAVQSGRGSGVDVAASTFGGVVRFTSDPKSARPVQVHADWRLVVVRAEASVATGPRVASYGQFATEHPEKAQAFLQRSQAAVSALEGALAGQDEKVLREAVGAARAALLQLQRESGLLLETPAIARAAQLAERHGCGGKQSGAGGGDCAVLLARGDEARDRLIGLVQQDRLEAFPVGIASEGVRGEPG